MSFESPPAGDFDGLNMDELGLDEAYLRVNSDDGRAAYLYGRNENCDKCPFETYGEVRTYAACFGKSAFSSLLSSVHWSPNGFILIPRISSSVPGSLSPNPKRKMKPYL